MFFNNLARMLNFQQRELQSFDSKLVMANFDTESLFTIIALQGTIYSETGFMSVIW